MPKKKVVLAGGSGFIGRSLASLLADEGYEVIILTRGGDSSGGHKGWDGENHGLWAQELESSLAVINLSGHNVNCRLTKANRLRIIDSRLNSARALAEAVDRCLEPPEVFVQLSAVGYYGDTGQECREDACKGAGFLSDVCSQLEETVTDAHMGQTRKCILRLGAVLGTDGGAYPVLARLTKCFMGGSIGGGCQYVSWVHIEDLCRIISALLTERSMNGIYNAVSPEPVTNAALMIALRDSLGRPWSPPVPAPIFRLIAYLINTNSSLILAGQKVSPSRLIDSGFDFEYCDIDSALKELSEK